MQLRPSDLEHLTDELKSYSEVIVMNNSVTSNFIYFATEECKFDVSFKMSGVEIGISGINKSKRNPLSSAEEMTVPFSLTSISGNYDEVIAELLFHLDVISEDQRDRKVYGCTFDW